MNKNESTYTFICINEKKKQIQKSFISLKSTNGVKDGQRSLSVKTRCCHFGVLNPEVTSERLNNDVSITTH